MAIVRLSRGLSFTILGFASKAYFIVLIAPSMFEGEFVHYFFATSIAVIAGRILGFGAREDLVYRIKHNSARITHYLRGGMIYYFGAFVCTLFAGVVIDKYEVAMLTVAYAMVIAGSNFLVGALRTYSNVFQEFTVTIPWFLVLVLSFLTEIHYANDILYLLLLGYGLVFVINLVAAYFVGIKIETPSVQVLIRQFWRYKAWLPKSLSSATLTADLRSYPIWLGSLGYVVSDGLAYAFVIGELVFQLCMVYVHQVHSNLRTQDDFGGLRQFAKISLLMFCLAVIVPVFVYQLVTSGYFIRVISIEYETMSFAALYCATWAFFSLVRIFVWRHRGRGGDVGVLSLQSVGFVVVGVLVMSLGQTAELLIIATLLNMTGILMYVRYLARNNYI